MRSIEKTIEKYIRYAFPLIHIQSIEYSRVTEIICKAVSNINNDTLRVNANTNEAKLRTPFKVYKWTPVVGIVEIENLETPNTLTPISRIDIPEEFLRFCAFDDDKTSMETGNVVYIVENFNSYWQNPLLYPNLIEYIKLIYEKRYINLHLIFVDNGTLPADISDYFINIDFPYPTEKEILGFIKNNILDELNIKISITPEELYSIASLCCGLRQLEIRNVVCPAIIKKQNKYIVDIETIKKEKANVVNKSGLLEFVNTEDTMEEVGGLEEFKAWAEKIAIAYRNPEKAKAFNLPQMKGTLIIGVSGTGKTLSAKALANLFGVPLFRLDIGRLFNSLVGETERNTRELFKLIDALGRCVILIDELEKAFGSSVSTRDSGVTTRLIGSFLYYWQEKTSPSFFVCTANQISNLPPELLRRGRLDEIWYVSLPSISELQDILTIHLKKNKRNPDNYDIKEVVSHMVGFTGADVEFTVKQALYTAFFEDRELTNEDLIKSASTVIPLSKMNAEKIKQLEEWATGRARKANKTKSEDIKRKLHASLIM